MNATVPNIVLIGFMGSGKTTVSRILGDLLEREVIDMDEEIARRAGYPSVAHIIDQAGESHFRDLESALAVELAVRQALIISPGGGIISRDSNMDAFVKCGARIVFLDCSFDTLRHRLSSDPHMTNDRPLFRDQEMAKQLFATRYPIYSKWATHRISSDLLSPIEISTQIVESLADEALK